jgi:hypothetical protein
MTKLTLRMLTGQEMADEDAYRAAESLAWAWHQWKLASCEERGGHWWFLDISPWEGVWLSCSYCGADVNDLIPDGFDLLAGSFEVMPGYVLTLDCGSVVVNERYQDRDQYWACDGLLITYGWKGPVSVNIRVEKSGGWEYPVDYDWWIELEAA